MPITCVGIAPLGIHCVYRANVNLGRQFSEEAPLQVFSILQSELLSLSVRRVSAYPQGNNDCLLTLVPARLPGETTFTLVTSAHLK